MTVTDCMKCAAENLNLESAANLLMPTLTAVPAGNSELKTLYSCACSVLHEIAVEYAQLIATQDVSTTDGIILYTAISWHIVEFIGVSQNGKKVPFRNYYNRIEVEKPGTYDITFAYDTMPESGKLNSTLEWTTKKISSRVVGLGITAEYCIRNGMNEEAVMWDKRYKDALAAAARDRKERRIPARRWL